MTSNLSKIKPSLRTTGRISGNFGKNKVRAGSTLNDLGVTTAKVVKCAKQEDYVNRLYEAYEKTDDVKLKEFLFKEIRNYHIKRGVW
jgi:hypothetical protein